MREKRDSVINYLWYINEWFLNYSLFIWINFFEVFIRVNWGVVMLGFFVVFLRVLISWLMCFFIGWKGMLVNIMFIKVNINFFIIVFYLMYM